MVIHYYQQFFTGPQAPGPTTPRKFMEYLAQRDNTVHVIATDYNVYTEQSEYPELRSYTAAGSIAVHRIPSPRGLRQSLRARLRTYLGFLLPAYRYAKHLPAPDIVLGSIQPLFTGLLAYHMAQRARAPFFLEVRDLWPDALQAKGAISPLAAAPLQRIAQFLYRKAKRIASLTPGIADELIKKGVDPTLIDVFPNGYDPVLLPTDTRARIRSEHGWGDQFVAIFVGTHVEVTAIDTIVKAASMLHGRPDIRFELFGKGQQKAAAIQLARNLDLRNIHFNDPVPKAVVPELLAGADAALMTLFKSPLINIYFENKLVDYLGAGKPILAAMDGMQSELIARNRAGLTVASLDYQGLARIVAYAADHPAEARQLGANGHAVACQHLLLTTILDHYAQALRHVAYGRSAQLPVWKPAV